MSEEMIDKKATEKTENTERIPWEKMKHEYITGNTTYKALSKKYGVSIETIKKKARKTAKTKGWVTLKSEYKNKAATKAEQISVEKDAKDIASSREKVTKIVDSLIKKVEKAVDELTTIVLENEKRTIKQGDKKQTITTKKSVVLTQGPINTKALKNLTDSVEKLNELLSVTGGKNTPVGIVEIPQMQKPVPPAELFEDTEASEGGESKAGADGG